MSAMHEPRAIERALRELFRAEPRLLPDPSMHDYQLTYPPAVQLERQARDTPLSTQTWLDRAVGNFDTAGFYFHFGFCRYRCRYCFHYELTTKTDEALMERYVDALVREMKHIVSVAPRLRRALYFLGGGTPTQLPARLLERFLGALTLFMGRPLTSMSTVEAKPITLDDDAKLDALLAAGFRRINLGVQTLDPELYRFHHHGEDLRIAFDAIERVRKRGFSYVNIDLMIGLERQTDESWQRSLDQLERLAQSGAIDSVFIYPFHDDPRSRTYAQGDRVPSAIQTAIADARGRALMTRLGWKELGARFFRSPRHVRRELWELARIRQSPAYGEVLYHGLGNSSFSIGDRATYINHRDVHRYIDAVERDGFGIAGWTELSNAQRAARDVTFDLLYSPVTRLRSRAAKYGAAAMSLHEGLISRWTKLGLGERNRWLGTFSLSPLGKLVHQQMIPHHYLPEDRVVQERVMTLRKRAGKAYRGY